MNRSSGRELAAIKMKRVDAKHSSVDLRICFQEFPERAARNIAATCEREMRVPRAQFWFDTDLERCFLNTFVQLKKMRMSRTDPDPNNFYLPSWRKCSNVFDWQEECAKLNRFEFFAKRKIDILRYIGKKTEREMNLIGRRPTHAANVRIEIG